MSWWFVQSSNCLGLSNKQINNKQKPSCPAESIPQTIRKKKKIDINYMYMHKDKNK